MNVLRSGALGIALLALGVTGASAGGPGDRDGLKDDYRSSIWKGAYLGAHIGGTWGNYDLAHVFDDGLGHRTYSLDPASFIGGVQVGYNFKASSVVLGVEADVSFARGKDDQIAKDDFSSVALGTHGTVTGRIGLPTGAWMPYIKGGFAWAHVNVHAADVDKTIIDPLDETRGSKTLAGWTIGGGLEYAYAAKWTLRAEYLFMDFESFTTTNLEGDPPARHSIDAHSVRLGLNYQLN